MKFVLTYEAAEKDYLKKIPREHRKKHGQYFTPVEVAALMCKWVSGAGKKAEILDPAMGLGVFFRKMIKADPGLSKAKFTGYESDRAMAEACRQAQPAPLNPSLEIKCEDYLTSEWDARYDCIVCNPPYIRFRDYEPKAKLLGLVEKHLGIKLSGFSNIYVLFLLKSLYQLSPGGRAAFIIPSEFLNSDYGGPVKRYLVESGLLRCVAVIDFSSRVFGHAATTSSILLFANDSLNKKIDFLSLKNTEELDLLGKYIDEYPCSEIHTISLTHTELDPDKKWSFFYNPHKVSYLSKLVPFTMYAHAYRGIATGCNEFFIFNNAKAQKYGIREKYLTDCVCSSSDIKGRFLDKTAFLKLRDEGANSLLLDITGDIDDALKEYIILGEKLGVNRRYLTKNRKPWFSMEQREPAPILAAVFNRGGLKFVRNEASVRNLTAYHCIYPTPRNTFPVDLMMAYFFTGISREIFDLQRREYGNGLEKFEPNDLNKAYVPDFESLSPGLCMEAMKFYELIKGKELNSEDAQKELCELNNIFTHLIS